jgi:hypothetical protein
MAEAQRLGEQAEIFLYESSGGAASIALANPPEPEKDLAWQAPECTHEDFKWIAESLAAYHKIQLTVVPEEDDDSKDF